MNESTLNGICLHTQTRIIPLPPGNKHFQELRCADCNAWLRFLPRPDNVERRRQNGNKLARLAVLPGLSGWERDFVSNIARQGGKLSPKQQTAFDDMCTRHLRELTLPSHSVVITTLT